MKLNVVAVSLLTLTAVAACGTTNRGQAEGSFAYVDSKLIEPLEPAEGLQLPAEQRQYQIPSIAGNSAAVGTEVNLLAPVQVRPIAAGARIEDASNETRAFFDDVEEIDDLSGTVWTALLNTVERKQIPVAQQQEEQLLVTDWYTERAEVEAADSAFWAFWRDDTDVLETKKKFRITQETASHGRTTSLLVELEGFERYRNGSTLNESSPLVERNAEAEFMNEVMASLYYIQDEVYRSIVNEGLQAELGFDQEGNPAYLLPTDFELAWTLTANTFEALGFTIEDLNKTNGRYYLNYTAGGGLMSSLAFWRDKKAVDVGLENGDYEVALIENDGRVALTIKHDEEMLDPARMSAFFDLFAAEFTQQSKL